MLSEWPVANIKYNAPWISPDKQTYEARFGMYYYDGTTKGCPKPIAYASKFFREYIDTHNPGDGTLDIVRADTPMKTGYIFTDKDALFVGNTGCDSERLKFKSPVPANVMLMWNAEQLKIMATADIEAVIDLSKFGFAAGADFSEDGQYASVSGKSTAVKIGLLKGQTVTFFIKKEQRETN
jgi:hypothetical protein